MEGVPGVVPEVVVALVEADQIVVKVNNRCDDLGQVLLHQILGEW